MTNSFQCQRKKVLFAIFSLFLCAQTSLRAAYPKDHLESLYGLPIKESVQTEVMLRTSAGHHKDQRLYRPFPFYVQPGERSYVLGRNIHAIPTGSIVYIEAHFAHPVGGSLRNLDRSNFFFPVLVRQDLRVLNDEFIEHIACILPPPEPTRR